MTRQLCYDLFCVDWPRKEGGSQARQLIGQRLYRLTLLLGGGQNRVEGFDTSFRAVVVSTWLCILAALAFVCWAVRCPVLSFGFAVRARVGGTCGVVIRRRGDSRSDERVD